MRKLRPWFFGFLLVLLFLQIWLGFPVGLEAPNERSSAVDPSLNESRDAEQKMKGVHLVETRSGARDWELFAQAAEGYEGKGKWQLQKVKVLFYSEGKTQFTVVGERAEIDTKTKDMKIEGSVRTQSPNGYVFESALLLYLAKQRLLQSPTPVAMRLPKDEHGSGLVIESQYMRSFVDQNEIELVGQVRASKGIRQTQKVLVRSSKAYLSSKSHSARFADGVQIEYETMKLEGPEASFVYEPNKSLLESIQVKGGVRINDVDKFATSELVQIDPEKNQVVLQGGPRVVQGQDELLGERIVFLDGGKKVKIEKMKARVEKTGDTK